jgi:hypothetical protein
MTKNTYMDKVTWTKFLFITEAHQSWCVPFALGVLPPLPPFLSAQGVVKSNDVRKCKNSNRDAYK